MAKRKKLDLSADLDAQDPTGLGLFSDVARDLGFKPASAESKPARISHKGKESRESKAPFKEEDLRGLKASLRIERKGRRGKTVTLVSGLSLRESALSELARKMKKAMGCGASIEERTVVVLQGDNRERLRIWLESRGVRVSG